MSQRSFPVSLTLHTLAPTTGTASVVDRSPPARVMRAVLALLACLGIAFLCVFIPIMHFVLVPGFLVTGVVLFFFRLRDHCTLVDVRAACPRCQTPRTFQVNGRYHDGRTIHCDGCGETLTVRAA